jgi:hypothetical protein
MNTQISEYEQTAIDFLNSTGTTFKAEFLKNDFHFDGDDCKRDIYKITLQRGSRKYSFNFGQSIAQSKKYKNKVNGREFSSNGKSVDALRGITYTYPEKFPKTVSESRFSEYKIIEGEAPTAYDVLACLQKYDVGTFEDFCGEFGYDVDSRKAEKIYNAVCEEYKQIAMLFNDEEIELLQMIN